MMVEVLQSFEGDLGPSTPVVTYDRGEQVDIPERIARKWIGRGLVGPVPVTNKAAKPKKES